MRGKIYTKTTLDVTPQTGTAFPVPSTGGGLRGSFANIRSRRDADLASRAADEYAAAFAAQTKRPEAPERPRTPFPSTTESSIRALF